MRRRWTPRINRETLPARHQSSNPKFHPEAVPPRLALALLKRITALPEHEFWPDELPLEGAVRDGLLISGHRQITDAYLVALAAFRNGIVATFDRGMFAVAGDSALVELLG